MWFAILGVMTTTIAVTTGEAAIAPKRSEVALPRIWLDEAPSTADAASCALYLTALSAALFYVLLKLWALQFKAGEWITTTIFGSEAHVSAELQLLIVASIAGALGGLLYAVRALYKHVAFHDLTRRWLFAYALSPVMGAILGMFSYFLARGGFFSSAAAAASVNLHGVAAVACLMGLFSQQAVQKLKRVAETMLEKAPTEPHRGPPKD